MEISGFEVVEKVGKVPLQDHTVHFIGSKFFHSSKKKCSTVFFPHSGLLLVTISARPLTTHLGDVTNNQSSHWFSI